MAYLNRGIYYESIGNNSMAIEDYETVIKLEPNNYSALVRLGYLYPSTFNYVKAIETLQEALIRSYPYNQTLLYHLSGLYAEVGFLDKAKNIAKEALSIDGDSLMYFATLLVVEFSFANYDNAIAMYEECIRIDSTYISPIPFYTLAGKHQEAYEHYSRLIELSRDFEIYYLQSSHRIGYAFWKVGKLEEADKYFNEQIKYCLESIKLGRKIATEKYAHYDLAGVYAFRGDKAQAYKYLDEVAERDFNSLAWINLVKNDPLFDSIQDEQRFQRFLKSIELEYQAEHERVRQWLEENDIF
jgi:tetratricopeptide (TPR) repeat protein